MTTSSKKNRIIFIDLLRAFAVLQMVQGHTTDVLLSHEYRSFEYPIYAVWLFMRGMTAPIFLFTAGTVFTYLFRLSKEPFENNPRVAKGLKRVLLLICLGYLLRFPTPTIIDFSSVTAQQIKIFLSVDVLHLISISLLLVIGLAYLSEKIFKSDYWVYGITAILFFTIDPLSHIIDWKNFLPIPLANYFTRDYGSLFPLIPWSGYVIGGAVLGSYLAKNPLVFKSSNFSIMIGAIGLSLIFTSLFGDYLEKIYYSNSRAWGSGYSIIFLRLGFVLSLTSLVALISIKIETIPKFFILVGRNTLLIYVVHLLILYGSAWNPSINMVFGKSLSGWVTFLSALAMLLLMTGLVIVINKLKIRNKSLVT